MAFQVEITPIAETIRDATVYVLYVRHIAQAPLTIDDLDDFESGV